MKNKTMFSYLLIGLLCILIISCKKDKNNNITGQAPVSITDIDGNIYHQVTIGTQVWLVENLKVTHYRNGDPIPNVTANVSWGSLTSGAYCNYNNDTNNITIYGRLYNFYAVADSRNIAPIGYHIPTDAEWTTLTNYLGNDTVAGGKLKETATAHWVSPNVGATNTSGFTALPGGSRDIDGNWPSTIIFAIGNDAVFWTINMSTYYIDNYNAGLFYAPFSPAKRGQSVRCVKD